MIILLIFFILYSFFDHSYALDQHSLYQATKVKAMGGASIAAIDDENAIFYNPAGLAGFENISFQIINSNADISNDIIDFFLKNGEVFRSFNIDSFSKFLGKNLDFRLQGASSFTLPYFGFAGFLDQQISFDLKNQIYLNGALQQMNTYGFQIAFGFPILKLKKKGGQLRLGVSGKSLYRKYNSLGLSVHQLLDLDLNSLVQEWKQEPLHGYGLDIGVQWISEFHKKKWKLMLATVATNLGDTYFGFNVPSIKNKLTLGAAVRYQARGLRATLAYDHDHLFESIDWRKKNHFGLEMKLPLLSLYAGVNEVFFTYGFGFDLWLIQFFYASYAQELATLVNQNPSRHYLLSANLKIVI